MNALTGLVFLVVTPLVAAQSWGVFPTSGTYSTMPGALLGIPATVATTTPATLALLGAPGVNPPYNNYCIWDSSVPQNSAQLWPASATTPSCAGQIILSIGGAATQASPYLFTVQFDQPILNPRMMIYSLDNSVVDLSATRDVHGAPAVLASTTNNAAVYDPLAQTLGTTGSVPIPEGCANATPAGRACAYVTFVGSYSTLTFSGYSTNGRGDGVGLMFGADASAPGAYKRVLNGPTDNGDGTFSATFEIGAQNTNLIDIAAFNLSDALSGSSPSFGTYTPATPTSPGTYTIPGGVSSCQLVAGANGSGASFAPNPAFTGAAGNLTLLAADTVLPAASATAPGEVSCQFTVLFAPAAAQAHFENSGVARATSAGTALTDISYNGSSAQGGDPLKPATDPVNNVPTPLDIEYTVGPLVSKSADIVNYLPGVAMPVTYTIVASNAGPDGMAGFALIDTPASGISVSGWTCAITTPGTAYIGVTTSCAAAGSGTLNTTIDLQPGASVTFTVDAVILSSASGAQTNNVSLAAPAGSQCTGACTSTQSSTVLPYPPGHLAVQKSVDKTSYLQGAATALTYNVTVTNDGAGPVSAGAVVDAAPADVAFGAWTCSITGAGTAAIVTNSCSASGSGNVGDSVTLDPGAVATYRINATIATGASGDVINSATATTPAAQCAATTCVSTASAITTAIAPGILGVQKSVDKTVYLQGTATQVVYTLLVTNNGSGPVTGGALVDQAPAGSSFGAWTCVITSAGSGTSVTNACSSAGNGDIADSITLNPGAVATYTINAKITASATGSVTNTATATTPPTQCVAAVCTSSASATTGVTLPGSLRILKSVDKATYTRGSATALTYTLVVTNTGTGAVNGGIVADAAPPGITFAGWICVIANPGNLATLVNTCSASGSGNVSDSISLNPGAVAIYTINATTAKTASGPLTNTATATVPGAPCAGTSPCTSTSSVTTADASPVTPEDAPVPVPALGSLASCLLAWLIACVAFGAIGRQSARRHRS